VSSLISYAQNFEDVMLWRALSNVEKGVYVDVGAQDPQLDSVSLLFYEHGWRGINVEPTPRYADLLAKSRPEDINVRAAVSAKAGALKFYEFPDTGLSTSDRQIAKGHIKKGFLANEIVVPSITLDEVFTRRRSDEIHWLKIDVEGSEKNVLKSWSRSSVRPWIVLVESTYPMSQAETHQQWEELILAKGYKFAYFDGLSRFYIANGHDELLASFSSGPNVFDVMFHGFSLSATTPFCGPLHVQILKLNEEKDAERKNVEQLLSQRKLEIASQDVLLLQQSEKEQRLVEREQQAVTALLSAERSARQQMEEEQKSHRERESVIQHRLSLLEHEQADREKQHSDQIGQVQLELQSLLRAIASREQEVASQVVLIHQQASDRIAKLEQEYRAREGELLVQQTEKEQRLVEREQQAAAALRSVEHSARQKLEEEQKNHRERESAMQQRLSRLEQEQADREKQHNDQIGQVQLELQSLLRAIASREEEVASQVALIHQQASDRIAKLEQEYRARESFLLLQQAEQNQQFAKHLHDLQHELKRIYDWHETELGAERRLTLNLRQALVEVHENIVRMRDSLTWRMTLPIRRMASFFKGGKKNERSFDDKRIKSARAFYELNQAATNIFDNAQDLNPANVNFGLINLELSVLEKIMSSSAMQTHAKILSIDQILNLYGDAFVVRAYEILLGRSPDSEGMHNYLQQLRAGDSREKIIAQIAQSPEGQKHGAELKGLADLIASQRASNRKMFGKFFRGNQIERQVCRVENEVGRLTQALIVKGAETSAQVASVQSALTSLHQLSEASQTRLSANIEKVSLETNARSVAIEQSIFETKKMFEFELQRAVKDITKLASDVNAISERFANAESISLQTRLVSSQLPQPTTLTKAYEQAIRPISVVREPTITPKFSIIILQFFKSELTINCVRSVLRYTPLESIEILVVDNGSSPEHISNLQMEFGNQITVLEVGINRYFGEGNNIGADFALGEFIVFMNNDIVVTHNWLDTLSSHLINDADVVGPTFLYPDGRVQECGAYIEPSGTSIQQFKGGSVKDIPQKPFECDYISAATILLKKSTFLKVGGFDLCYEPAYYEDVDLCLKIASYGGKVICVPSAKIFHNENATSSDATLGLNLSNDIVSINKSKFLDRWRAFLSDRVESPIDKQKVMGSAQVPLRLSKIAMLPKKAKRAILFSPYPLTPGGGEKYLLTIAQELSDKYDTTLAFEYRYSASRMRQLESYLNLNLINVALMDFSTAKDQPWDLSFVLGNSIAPPFPKLAPTSFYICQFPFDQNSYVGKPIPHSDQYHYLCYSDFVKNHILNSEYIQKGNVSVLAPVIQTYPSALVKEKVILSVGRFFAGGHCKNQLLLIEAFKTLIKHPSFADWRLILVGSTRPEHVHRIYYTQCIQSAQGFNVEVVPDASFDVLSVMYAKASMYWHGSGLGVNPITNPEQLEHFGITPLEAASAGCHVFIPDAGGPREIGKKAPGKFHAYSSIDELVRSTIKVYSGGLDVKGEMQHQMEQFIDTFSIDTFGKTLSNLIAQETLENNCDYTTVIRPGDYRARWLGWSYIEHDYMWSALHESKIEFLWAGGAGQRPMLTLEFNAFGAQKIRIQLNGCLVIEKTVAASLQFLTFEAPGLVAGFNSLNFSFPNAHQPGNSDPRMLAIAFRSLSFTHDLK
jgi:FkbM family methyltransferase